jgi:hypothetical protein
VTQHTEGATIRFDATLTTIGTSTVLRLPQTASNHLPSRGQVTVRGTINGVEFGTVLEPDGHSGHWMRVDDTLQDAAGISAGETATVGIEVTKDWPEPSVRPDLAAALAAARGRSRTCGTRPPRWRGGNGCGGSTPRRTLTRAAGGSR